jgi:hypothetical protein
MRGTCGKIFHHGDDRVKTTGFVRGDVLSALLLVTTTVLAVSVSEAQISAVWANDGGDKVLRHELRAATARPTNSVWDGRSVRLFGARNEVIGFNLVLESKAGARAVNVAFNELLGPQNTRITSRAAAGDEIFSYVGRNIELFYVRYLQIRGLSKLSYDTYDERHVPSLMRRPFTVSAANRTVTQGDWSARPGADKFFPDIAIPLELHPNFAIPAAMNQSVWVDIYIPKNVPSGEYKGTITISVDGAVASRIPVLLEVLGFALPDQPAARTMIALEPYDIAHRYTGKRFPEANDPEFRTALLARDRHFLLARRHKLTLIGGGLPAEEPNGAIAPPTATYQSMLKGTFFSQANGYAGPGEGLPLDLYVIGPYGSAAWSRGDRVTVHKRMDEWEGHFRANFPGVERFLYDIDEPNLDDQKVLAEINTRLDNYKSNLGAGKNLKIFTTAYIDKGVARVPRYDIFGQWVGLGVTNKVQQAVDAHRSRGGLLYHYNGIRPGSGSFAIEDDGVSPRTIAWAQMKLGIHRHFYYLLNYYNDYQTSGKQTNVFASARTYGIDDRFDPVVGRTGWNYSNGDGVLSFPGTDKLFPEESYGRLGAFASLRLKHWRRGVQDADYIALARQKDAKRVDAIVQRIVPRVYWEVGVEDLSDPSWKLGDISWSTNPDVWEAARRELAGIIAGSANAARPAAPGALIVR